MTPEFLTGLGALLLSLRDWVEHDRPDSLDVALVTAVIDLCGRERADLVRQGSK